MPRPIRVAEFFAGIGLMREGLERAGGYDVVWANDIEPTKIAMYAANHSQDHVVLDDVRHVHGNDLPDVELATASFPCTDLSLAGYRSGLIGDESSMFWEFARRLVERDQAQERLPEGVLLENVVGFATSNGGRDLEEAIASLNKLGYICDVLVLDASWWVPQSRPRMFIAGLKEPVGPDAGWEASPIRPRWIGEFLRSRPHLKVHAHALPVPERTEITLTDVVDRPAWNSRVWWDSERVERFISSLSERQRQRLDQLVRGEHTSWRTAYRRTRQAVARWEIRADSIAGCLRTARGGSSRQAVVEAGRGKLRIRWMSAREYAKLQGAPEYNIEGFTDPQVVFGFGDAVCVDAVAWVARHLLTPALDRGGNPA